MEEVERLGVPVVARLAAVLGLLVAGAMLAAVWVLPDDPPGLDSMRHGFTLAVVYAAAPTAALARNATAGRVASLGAGMTLAGAATTPGGNLAGLLMGAVGIVLTVAAATRNPPLTWRVAAMIVVYGVALVAGVILAVSPPVMATIGALAVAGAIAYSTRVPRTA